MKNQPTLHRLEDCQFADIVVALGSLALAGVPCKFVKSPGWGGALLTHEDGSPIAGAYRDGSSYKVKSELILDCIEKHAYTPADHPAAVDAARDAEAADRRDAGAIYAARRMGRG